MVHAIEAYTSKVKKNPMSDQLARQALALLSANVRRVCKDGRDLEARSQMLLGSMLAGMAFANAPVAAVHALAYPIGAIFHVPHGLVERAGAAACARIQPVGRGGALCRAGRDRETGTARAISRRERARAFIDEMTSICRDCKVPPSLSIGRHRRGRPEEARRGRDEADAAAREQSAGS